MTMSAMSHLIARSPSVSAPISSATYRNGRGLSLNLPAFGGRAAPLGLQVRKGDAFRAGAARQARTGLALALDRRKRGRGPAALGSFLDRGIDLAESPVEVRDRVGHNLDPGRKGAPGFDGSCSRAPVAHVRRHELGLDAGRV